MPGFITLTIIANAAAMVVLPVLSASLWYITARTSFSGQTHRNGWRENSLMATLFAFSLWGAHQSVLSVAAALQSGS
jgi:hypothetical protein